VVSPLFVESLWQPPRHRRCTLPTSELRECQSLRMNESFASADVCESSAERLAAPRKIVDSQIRRIRDSRQLPALLS